MTKLSLELLCRDRGGDIVSHRDRGYLLEIPYSLYLGSLVCGRTESLQESRILPASQIWHERERPEVSD